MPRPTKYHKKLADEITIRLTNGETLRKICKDEHIPSRQTVINWLNQHEEFFDQYLVSRQLQAEHFADEILEIADSCTSQTEQATKIQIEARKWHASRTLTNIKPLRGSTDERCNLILELITKGVISADRDKLLLEPLDKYAKLAVIPRLE